MKFGLSERTILLIKKVFEEFKQIDEVILYGSRAKGNYKEGSDIDYCLKGSELTNIHLSKINAALEDCNLPYFIDLSIYHLIQSTGLVEHIDRSGIVFYSSRSKVENT